MNPGAEPVIAVTLPIGLRYAEERSLASLVHWLALTKAPRFARPRRPPAAGAKQRGRGQTQVVELTGIEPVASWLQTRRSPS